MKLGIMQPYIFPYIGYFQLLNAVDRFVVYDDVTFIKQGWINRNKILLNGAEHVFTVPLKNASSFITIGKTEINNVLYSNWANKFLKTIGQAYSKAPHFHKVFELLNSVMNGKHDIISELATSSIVATCNYLGVEAEFVETATGYANGELKAKDRVIDICKKEKADIYINPIGGRELYSRDDFEKSGLLLNFIRSKNITYRQLGNEFVPWLSVIDVMMFNAPEVISGFLNEYELE